MEIIAQTKPAELTFYEGAYLQTGDDVEIFEAELETVKGDPVALDGFVSNFDFLFEMPTPELLTFGKVWLPSVTDYFETFYSLVTRNFIGHYAIYRKAWL